MSDGASFIRTPTGTLQGTDARPLSRPDYSLFFDHSRRFAARSRQGRNKIYFGRDACFCQHCSCIFSSTTLLGATPGMSSVRLKASRPAGPARTSFPLPAVKAKILFLEWPLDPHRAPSAPIRGKFQATCTFLVAD